MKKYHYISVAYLLSWVLLLTFMQFRWDILIGRPAIAGTLTSLLCMLAGCVLVLFAVVYSGLGIRRKSLGYSIPLLLCSCCLLYSFFFVFTLSYAKINQKLYCKQREQVIDSYNRGELQQYRIGDIRYISPQRLASYDGTVDVYVDEDGGIITFRTFVGVGKNAALLYVAKGSFVPEQFVGGQLQEYLWLDEHWIYAVYRTYSVVKAKK